MHVGVSRQSGGNDSFNECHTVYRPDRAQAQNIHHDCAKEARFGHLCFTSITLPTASNLQ